MRKFKKPTELSYDDWIEFVFNHQLPNDPDTDTVWYWDDSWDEYWDMWKYDTDAQHHQLSLSTRLFTHSNSLIKQYSPGQINQGFWMILSGPWGFGLGYLLWMEKLPCEDRISCVRSMVQIYSGGIFGSLPNIEDPYAILTMNWNSNPLMESCYMWWDHLRSFKEDPDPKVLNVTLESMSQILQMPSYPAQLSSLHGLGHLDLSAKREIILKYLEENPHLHPNMKKYAEAAMDGSIM